MSSGEKLTYIASEKFKGRGNGTPELNMAAEYIAGIFEKNGLKPAGRDGKLLSDLRHVHSPCLVPSNSFTFKTGAPAETNLRSAPISFRSLGR